MTKDLVAWSESFNLGLEEIDEQHRMLLKILNETWRSIVRKADQAEVLRLVEDLERYTLAHFAAEETFMRVTDYPDFGEHKIEHVKFMDRVAEERKRAIEVGTLSLDLVYFLRDWLVDHILVSDRNYADFYRKQGVGGSSLLGRFFKRFFGSSGGGR